MVERDDLADIDEQGPWEREDEDASKEQQGYKEAPPDDPPAPPE